MIFYATKLTMERYSLKTPDKMVSDMKYVAQAVVKKERENRLYEWGCKLFYFDRRKCIQVVHFASKLTIFLVDIKVNDLNCVGNAVAQYCFDIFKDDRKMQKALEKYYESSPVVIFDKITDKSIIATLNRNQTDWAMDGYRFYDYISDGILRTRDINKDVNTKYILTMTENGKTEYFFPAERFRDVILKNFG